MTPVPPRPNHLVIVALIAVLVGVSNPGESAGVNPLRPADRSSPRATLQGFVEALDEAYLRLHELLNTYAASNRLYLSPAERQRQIAILSGALRATHSLDTSRLPPVLRDTLAAERALQLKEILDRIEFPAFNDVPDRGAMAQSSATRWRLPETEIDIVLIGDGPQAGEYLVSADTVDRLSEFYQRVRNLPYKAGPAKQLADLYGTVSSNRTSTVYESLFELASRLGQRCADPLDAEPAGLGQGLRRWRRRVAVAGIAFWPLRRRALCLWKLSPRAPPCSTQRERSRPALALAVDPSGRSSSWRDTSYLCWVWFFISAGARAKSSSSPG